MTMTVALVLESHLGHRTYGDNLLRAAADDPSVEVRHVPIPYARARTGALAVLDRTPVGGALAGRREVRAGLHAVDADVWVYNTQVPAALAGRAIREPYIVVTDVTPIQYDAVASDYGHRADRPGPLRAWKRRVNRRVFQNAAHCVGWSEWVVRSLRDDYGIGPERTSVIPPGVDTSTWCPGESSSSNSCRILFVGGDFERKGGRDLLAAFRSVSDRAELCVVTKSDVATAEGVTVVRDLEPNDPRLVEIFRTSDVFVLPSRAEAFGIAAIEASAVGLPVIGCDVGGVSDIVAHGKTGLLVRPGDIPGLADALCTLVDDEHLRARMGAAARARAVSAFDAETNALRLFDLARRAAGR